jgi:hypothetical protein
LLVTRGELHPWLLGLAGSASDNGTKKHIVFSKVRQGLTLFQVSMIGD